MFKIGLSTATKITEELFASYKRAGIECMEVSRGKEETDAYDYDKIKEWSEKYGIELYSFHLPFMPFGVLDISNPNLAESTIEYLKDIIDKACAIGIDKFIIHASGEPIDENDRTKRMECAKNSLNILATYTKERGAVLCVEDLPRTCLGRDSSDILELISANENLRVCFDTNHLLEEENIDFIRKVGDKIITLHVSDYDRVNERHWLPGEGINDWQQIISELNKIGYSGAWLYEIDYQTGTIIRDRAIVDEDFVRNAKELFENKPLTLFSKPKPNLGYWN
jgi:sugar phosphate isomerase/epimerase